jgi:hypothetical protein
MHCSISCEQSEFLKKKQEILEWKGKEREKALVNGPGRTGRRRGGNDEGLREHKQQWTQ